MSHANANEIVAADDAVQRSAAILPIQLSDGGVACREEETRAIGERHAGEYSFADPFPHIVFDNFLPPDVAQLALDHFPSARLKSDVVFDAGYAGLHKRQIMPAACDASARALFHFFNSPPMLEFLEGLSSIQGLIPDPHFAGGGYHETSRGGKLGIHADFRINERLHLHRRMNVIIYLNQDWKDEYGGFLELWDRKMTRKCVSVAPKFNRCVVFNTDADSFHGHPDPLACPADRTRRSIALYYYTASKEVYNDVPNVGTLYQARTTDAADVQREARRLERDQYLKQWLPPAVFRHFISLRRRMKR